MSIDFETEWLGKSLEIFDELGSTNTYLKEHADKFPHGAAVIAKRQIQGRGRLGREWQQSGGENLALSVLLHNVDPKILPVLPLIAGVAVTSALNKLCGISTVLKWSNDVLLEGRKLCGILCESRIAEKSFAVIGIGVNLSGGAEDFERLGLVYATSLKLATDKNYGIFEVAAKICRELEPILENFAKNGFDDIREEYKRRCVTLGREVCVDCNGKKRNGKALDIGADGSLICELDGERVSIHAGEASVRGLYGYAE